MTQFNSDFSSQRDTSYETQPPEMIQDDLFDYEGKAPILPKRETLKYPYTVFKKMKQFAKHTMSHNWSRELNYVAVENFLKQAQFMSDFVDYCTEIVPFEEQYPFTNHHIYEEMTDAQLRTYFTWRTKVRQGFIENTSLSYYYCYINELINNIGVKSAFEAIDKMITLWTAFREYNNIIDYYMRLWVRDYYLEHKKELKIEFSQYSKRFPIPYHSVDNDRMAKAVACKWDDLQVIEASSFYKMTKGKFYNQCDQKIIEDGVCYTVRELAKVFEKGGVDFRKLFFEKLEVKIDHFYPNAVHIRPFYLLKNIIVDDFETIRYHKGIWYREYISLTHYKYVLGYVLKLVAIKMRRHFNFKEELKPLKMKMVEDNFLFSEPYKWPNIPSLKNMQEWKRKTLDILKSDNFEKAIEKAITEFCRSAGIHIFDISNKPGKSKKKRHEVIDLLDSDVYKSRFFKPADIVIDTSKLKDIERDHNKTLKRLIVEEVDEKADIAVPSVKMVVATGIAGLISSLPPEGRELLIILLAGEQAPLNSEILVDTINEMAQACVADNLVENADGVLCIYDEYIDEVRGALGSLGL